MPLKKKSDGLEAFVEKRIKGLKRNKFYYRYVYILVVMLTTIVAALYIDPVMKLLTKDHNGEIVSFVPEDEVNKVTVAKHNEDVQVSEIPEDESLNQGERINLNTASVAELDTLPGIGATRAKNIVEMREKMGGFRTVNDLLNVEGIGEKILEKIEDKVFVE